jgi:RHS repeat-associated protein
MGSHTENYSSKSGWHPFVQLGARSGNLPSLVRQSQCRGCHRVPDLSLDVPWFSVGPGTTPYATIHMDNPAEAACLDGNHRCELSGNNAQPVPTTCEFPGVDEDCRLVDTNVAYPITSLPLQDQLETSVYYYAVTAVRGTEESPFSVVNQGWPHYCPASGACSPDRRYDPDNLADIACGDENANLVPKEMSEERLSLAQAVGPDLPAATDKVDTQIANGAPYRAIGIIQNPNDEGGGGGTSPPPATYRMLYYHLDHLGSPRVIVDATGSLISKHDYMPFGEEIPVIPQNSSNTRAFTGHERDSSTAQDYMLARYYSSGLGRFTAVDRTHYAVVAGLPQSWNRYSYAYNSPIGFTDPTGLWPAAFHYTMSYLSAGWSGFSATDADTIALGTFSVDFGTRTPWNPRNQREWHAFGDPSRAELLVNALAEDDLFEFGARLHPIGDWWAHHQYNVGAGHFWDGTGPDSTSMHLNAAVNAWSDVFMAIQQWRVDHGFQDRGHLPTRDQEGAMWYFSALEISVADDPQCAGNPQCKGSYTAPRSSIGSVVKYFQRKGYAVYVDGILQE